jgi:hypothetical protein
MSAAVSVSGAKSMSEHILQAIQELEARLRDQERDVKETKSAINSLCKVIGRQPPHDLDEPERIPVIGSIRPDQFYGQPLSTIVRDILLMRKAANLGAASVAEIYRSMRDGGYAFETTDDANAQRGLRISLTKNSQTFHKLPNGRYGLREWYPSAKEPKAKRSAFEKAVDSVTETDSEESADET